MFVLKVTSALLLIALSTARSSHDTEDYQNTGFKTVLRVYDECSKADGGMVPCIKKKAVTFMDRVSKIESLNVGEGVKLLRLSGADTGRSLTENELESSLPRNVDDRDNKLSTLLIERIANFFNGHTLQINFPKVSSEDLGRGIEEGRTRMKKMMGMMMMGMAMKMVGLIPIAMAGLYLLAGKALIVSKIALLLAAIVGLKKLLGGKGGGGGGGSSGYSSGGTGGWSSGGGHSGGWDRRSADNANDLAYRGYVSQ